MKILDACVGGAEIYEGMNNNLKDDFVSIDIRKGRFSFKFKTNTPTRRIIVRPKILATMKVLPFRDNTFDCIIIDPPHIYFGKTSLMNMLYGSWKKSERIGTVYKANIEFKRVLKNNGVLILKIMPVDKYKYMRLLDNFVFFLPIQSKKQAMWLIGILKS